MKFSATLSVESVTLSAEEEREFTPLNCLAFDNARKEALVKNTRIPLWLCSSEETKARYRQAALQILNENVNPPEPFDDGPNLAIVESFIVKFGGKRFVEQWKLMELEHKRLREQEHNPQAFFC